MEEIYEFCIVGPSLPLCDPPPFPNAHVGINFMIGDSGFRWYAKKGSRDMVEDFSTAGWSGFKIEAIAGATLLSMVERIRAYTLTQKAGITSDGHTQVLDHRHTLVVIYNGNGCEKGLTADSYSTMAELARLGQYYARCVLIFSHQIWDLGRAYEDAMAKTASVMQSFGWVVVNADQHYESLRPHHITQFHHRYSAESSLIWTSYLLRVIKFACSFVLPTFWVIDAKSNGQWPTGRTLPSRVMYIDRDSTEVSFEELSEGMGKSVRMTMAEERAREQMRQVLEVVSGSLASCSASNVTSGGAPCSAPYPEQSSVAPRPASVDPRLLPDLSSGVQV